jgi:hypothetical protein
MEIKFEAIQPVGQKEPIYYVSGNGQIGTITYNKPSRQWLFNASQLILNDLNADELKQITAFIENLT